MMFAGVSLASSSLAAATPFSTSLLDPWNAFPLTVLHNNIHVHALVKPNTITIDDTQGEQVSASIVFVNQAAAVQVGDRLDIRYFDCVLFSGTIEQVEVRVNTTLVVTEYHCTAVDWTQSMVRRKVNRSFSGVPISTLVSSVLENELSDEGFTFGSTDQQGNMELIEANNVTVLDLLRDVAGVNGQILLVDYDKSLHFLSVSNPSAPFNLTYAVVETASLRQDRENYRNVQTVIAEGTPASQSETVLKVQVIEQNEAQIEERRAIEGGSGRYEHIQQITHPTLNTELALSRIAQTYVQLLLAIGGTPRSILVARVRGYGFRAGQALTADLAALGIVGAWLIQHVTIREEDGRRLVYELELVQSSLQQRVYEAWAAIIGRGRVLIAIPTAPTGSTLESFTTVGTAQWISPVTGTITITTMGGSGGGAYSGGKKGGNSGKTVSFVSVAVDDVIDIVVGDNGVGGTVGSRNGTAGAASWAMRGSTELSYAEGGGGANYFTNTAGTPGGGRNGVVTIGGGKVGGNGGNSSSHLNGYDGVDGAVTIEY